METEVRTEFYGAESLLYAVKHRPWLPPNGPWIMTQTWNDLAFLHYAIEPKVLRALVPETLTLDLYQGNAWLSVTPFVLSHLRPPGVPSLPLVSRFPELNVRTYVTYGGKPGVFFFSLDAGNLSAVWGARMFYRLPYWHADMKAEGSVASSRGLGRAAATDVEIAYRSRRIHGPRAESGPAEFRARYRPSGPSYEAAPRSLDQFLAERYCLYAWNRRRLYRAEIHHLPWPLQPCEVEVEKNTMAEPVGIRLPEAPDVARFSRVLKVLVWPPHRLK